MYYDGEMTYPDSYVADNFASPAEAAKFGIYKVIRNVPEINCNLSTYIETGFVLSNDAYLVTHNVVMFAVYQLGVQLAWRKAEMQSRFKVLFDDIEYRCTRATQDIVARNIEILNINQDLAKVSGDVANELIALREELERANTEDGKVIVNLRQIAEENRVEMKRLLALEIVDDMPLKQAQTITMEIANAQPWLPWGTQQGGDSS